MKVTLKLPLAPVTPPPREVELLASWLVLYKGSPDAAFHHHHDAEIYVNALVNVGYSRSNLTIERIEQ